MQSRMALSVLTLLSSSSLAGCYSTWDIAPHTLTRLNGFRAGDERTIQTRYGDEITFTSGSEIQFFGTDGKEAQMQFRTIDFEDRILAGEREKDGAKLYVDLWRVRDVKIKNFSEAKSALAVTGIIIAAGSTLIPMMFIASDTGASGRPLRFEDSINAVRAPVFLDQHPQRHLVETTDEMTRARLLAYWANEASAECASIPAFLALARDLQRASAPTNLVRAALRAAQEEATHTRLCLETVAKHAGSRATTILPAIPPANDATYEALLERLVLEAFWDGCLAEGTAAALARRNAPMVKDEKTRLALQTIAHDEQGHADLAREIIRFGLEAGGRAIRNALAESIERRTWEEEKRLGEAWENGEIEEDFDVDFARGDGLPGRTEAQAARVEAWERNVLLAV